MLPLSICYMNLSTDNSERLKEHIVFVCLLKGYRSHDSLKKTNILYFRLIKYKHGQLLIAQQEICEVS